MKKKRKRFMPTILIMLTSVILFSITAFAAGFSFSLKKGESRTTVPVTKTNTIDYAKITGKKGNVDFKNDVLKLSALVAKTSNDVAVPEFQFKKYNYTYSQKYNPGKARKNFTYRLKGKSYKYTVYLEGVWTP